jgi:hypothetical protein
MIHVIGDSHVMRFIQGDDFKSYETHFATAYNMINPKSSSRGRQKAFDILSRLHKNDRIMFVYGEIDCRHHIMKHVNKTRTITDVVNDCVDRYMMFLLDVKNNHKFKNIMVMGPVASTPYEFIDVDIPTIGTTMERNIVTAEFNNYLKKRCKEHNIEFYTIFNQMISSGYKSNSDIYERDMIHIKPEIQTRMFLNEYCKAKPLFEFGGYKRQDSMLCAVNLLNDIKSPVIVEIGQTNNEYTYGDQGYSTPFLTWYINRKPGGKFYSLDSNDNILTLRKIFKKHDLHNENTYIIRRDGIEFLKDYEGKIDLLYLDAWDYIGNDETKVLSIRKHLEAFLIAEDKLADKAVIVIDDVFDFDTFMGKGQLLIPMLIRKGYNLIHEGHQFVFQKS